jgi:hypothetical protein
MCAEVKKSRCSTEIGKRGGAPPLANQVAEAPLRVEARAGLYQSTCTAFVELNVAGGGQA